MKLSNDLDADSFRLKNVVNAQALTDGLNGFALAPYAVATGETFKVQSGTQLMFSMPISFTGTGAIQCHGAMVEVS